MHFAAKPEIELSFVKLSEWNITHIFCILSNSTKSFDKRTGFRHGLRNFINKFLLPKKTLKKCFNYRSNDNSARMNPMFKVKSFTFSSKTRSESSNFWPGTGKKTWVSSKRRTRPEFLGQFSNIHFHLLGVQSLHLLHSSFYRGIKK